MSTKKLWLNALKEIIEEELQSPRKDLEKPTAATMQNVQKLREKTVSGVADLEAIRVLRGKDERRLLAAGWSPKEQCGPLALTIWANPETGFYCSQEIALHRLDQAPA